MAAKVKTERIVMDGAIPKEIDFKYDVYVDAEGNFTTTLAPEIVELMERRGFSFQTNGRRNGRKGYFSARTLDSLVEEVKNLCREYLSREMISEKIIIRYQIQTSCAYLVDDEGEIVPNGRFVNGYGTTPEKDWRGGTNDLSATNRHSYGIQIFIEPRIKREYRYRSGMEKTEYARINGSPFDDAAHLNPGKYLLWLDGIVGMDQVYGAKMYEIDYDETVAYFFVNIIQSVCKLNERIKEFVDPEGIKMLIDRGQNLLSNK